MGIKGHLKIRGATYYWRRKVPLHLVARFGKKELSCSLRTGRARVAVRRARQMSVICDYLFEMAENQPALTPPRINELSRQWLRSVVSQAEIKYAAGGAREPADVARRLAYGKSLEASYQSALASNELDFVAPTAKQLLTDHEIALDKGDPAFAVLCRTLLRAGVEASRIIASRLQGRYDYVPSDPLFRGLEQDLATGPERSSEFPSALTLADLIDRHVAAYVHIWTGQTARQNAATFKLFLESTGKRSFSSIERQAITRFAGDLRKLHRSYGQLPGFRDKTFKEMVQLTERDFGRAPKVGEKTVNRHLSAISGLFRWAREEGLWRDENPVAGLIKKPSRAKGPTRRPWRKEELQRLFALPPWTGCRSEDQRLVRGKLVVRDAYFFVPLIALFSGMRLNEICKLRSTDFRETDDDMWMIDVVGNEEGRVKEGASNRTVPVHPELVRLGLLAHVRTIDRAGQQRLWPELKRGGVGSTFGTGFGKWFTRARSAAGIQDRTLVFHSFRHNVSSALRRVGVNESVAADILGHAHKSMSYRIYSEGAAVRPLYDAICKIDYGLDLSKLYLNKKAHTDKSAPAFTVE